MSDKTPNEHLAALIREAGMTNKGLAKRMRDLSESDGGQVISPTHTNVEKWIRGDTKKPKDRTCRVLVAVLGRALGRDVSLAEVGYGQASPETDQDSTLDYPESIAGSSVALGQLAGHELRGTRSSDELLVVPDAWNTLLAKWMFGGAETATPPAQPRPISEIDVHAVHDATSMFANYDYRYGGGRPKPLVAQYLESDVLPTLPGVDPTKQLGREYLREVAALTRLAGWTCYDTGQQAFAQRYLHQAFRIARAAGDKPLCGRILAGMSHQANFLGHFEQAVHLARAASQGAYGSATPTAMALFHAMEARALSSQGNESEATAAMLAAEQYLGQGNPENDPDWIRYFDTAELHAEFAHCFRELRKPGLATHHATKSIEVSDSLYVRSLSFCRTVLATGHLQADDVEQAVSVAKEVVGTAARLRSFRVVSYLDDFRRRLAQHSDGAVAVEFDEFVREQMPSEGAPATGRLTVS